MKADFVFCLTPDKIKNSEGSYMPCDATFPPAIVKKHRDQLRTKRKMEYKGKKEK